MKALQRLIPGIVRRFAVAVSARAIRLGRRSVRRRGSAADLARLAASGSSDGIIVQSVDGTILWANAAYGRICGQPSDGLIGRKPQDFLTVDGQNTSPLPATFYRPDGPEFQGSTVKCQTRSDGSIFWNRISCTYVPCRGGDRVVMTCRDVTAEVTHRRKLANAETQMRREARLDPLTGLGNRLALDEFARTFLAQDARTGLLLLDLDNFKTINDVHGHAAGDAVLIRVAKVLRTVGGAGVRAFRLGGDEFLAVVPGCDDLDRLTQLGNALRRELLQPAAIGDTRIPIHASYGGALSTAGGDGLLADIAKADFALYGAKRAGRNEVQVFDAPAAAAFHRQRVQSVAVRKALDSGAFELLFQPAMHWEERRLIGFEALVRWQHPDLGRIAPDDFFDLLTEPSMRRDLDNIVITKALAAKADLEQAVGGRCILSMNVFSDTLIDPGFVDYLKWNADNHDLDYDWIVIELMESTITRDIARRVEDGMRLLRRAGFEVVLDDFGSGHSGLSRVIDVDVTGIKVASRLVAHAVTDNRARAAFHALQRLAQDLNLHLIAKGVETEAQAQHLLDLGAPLVQGGVVADPMSLAETLDWIARQRDVALHRPAQSSGNL